MEPFKVSTGETITFKKFVSRGLKKRMNEVLFKDTSMEGKKIVGLNMVSVEKSKDILLLGMIDKITLPDGKDQPVTIDFLDSLPYEDMENITKELNKLAQDKEAPKV